jgi:hypothetical protein
MAAGLAHELNNPATAARKAAVDLRQSVEKFKIMHESIKRSVPSSAAAGCDLKEAVLCRDPAETEPARAKRL